jgi:ribosomal protein S18 acetylase RimI-like enzyme
MLNEDARDPAMQLYSAAQFSIEELTAAYNQTRVDYLVPMPMNAARLAAYVNIYDIHMPDSLVAIDPSEAGSAGQRGEMLGLAMLGLRAEHVWVTRLGVLPVRRRRGTGEALVRGLLEAAEQRGIRRAILEVIKGNTPAHSLFRKLGFVETRELLVMRRPPNAPRGEPLGQPTWLAAGAAVDLLASANLGLGCDKPMGLAWTNEVESFRNAEDTQGLRVDLGTQGRGWLIFRRERFVLSHFVFHTEAGDPAQVGTALLSQLYFRYPLQDTYLENIAAGDPHCAALAQYNCIEVFRRVEMVREIS